jgi:hypothetical protein
MVRRLVDPLFSACLAYLPFNREALKEALRDRRAFNIISFDDEKHFQKTAEWLCRAHDSSGDDGVSRGYSAAKNSVRGRKGWQPSYPETTGYIIPTMFEISRILSDKSYSERALRMADWECGIQLASGAVMGSVVSAPPSPAIFNTGQVIFGWLAAHKDSGEGKYLKAASRAGDFLLAVQEADGGWLKGNSRYALNRATTYNARVAWALIMLGRATGREAYVSAGRRNIDYAIGKQIENGWFRDNCLNDPDNPLLHTIIYATRGILESGICLNEQRYIEASLKTLDALIERQRPDGGIPGRLSSNWSSTADWDCVTGDAQAAIAWLRAYSISGVRKYKDAGRKAIEFIKRTQNLEHPNPGIRGGVKGSFPFDGPYGKFEMLNWAAKFFCDALMLVNDDKLAKVGIRG